MASSSLLGRLGVSLSRTLTTSPVQTVHLRLNNPLTHSSKLKCCLSTSSTLSQQRSKILSHEPPLAATGTVMSKDESRDFMALFPDIVRELTDRGRHSDIPDVNKWFAKVLQYNVPSGKKNRGLALVVAYKMLAQSPPDQDSIQLAQILGWCVEILQAFLLVLDDVMDNATTRRGRPCWYRHNHIGLAAVNDALLLEQAIYQLLRRHFAHLPYYVHLIHLFHDLTLKTSMGQSLDLSTANDLSKFTMDRYEAIVKYKTSYYSFQLPIALAMYMAGMEDVEVHRQARTLLLEMGHFFQVQDDYLDCFGTPDVTGKIGTDIEDGKCSWLAVVALQRATADQRKVMEECYGSKDPSHVSNIKNLYLELGLPSTFSTYEEESYNLINTHIQQLSRGLNQDLFYRILEKIYKRQS
uniref:Farnesyl pyrophosphate synthase n=1 Tax=Cacopsylla melanoneura TaxID=428564 RepID=A0A8D8RE77_9HEMI